MFDDIIIEKKKIRVISGTGRVREITLKEWLDDYEKKIGTTYKPNDKVRISDDGDGVLVIEEL